MDVPCNTLVRDLKEERAPGRRVPSWRRAEDWVKTQDGAKGPKGVRALEAWVQTKDEDGRVGPQERLVVIRTVAQEPQVWYTLSQAAVEIPLRVLVGVHGRRHGIEEVLQAAKGEVGLGHYEMRSWVGWHHPMTLSLLALWFLLLEKGRVGKKNPGVDSAADA